MKRKIISLSIALVGLIAFILTGCSSKETSSQGENQGKFKDTIVYGVWTSPDGIFNPSISNTSRDADINKLVYSSLLKYDKDLNVVPDLAKDYKVSEDGTTITFEIKEGIKWHDGKPLTIDDVIFTFKSIADPNYIGPRYGNVEKIKGVSEYKQGKSKEIPGIEKVNDKTIKFTFKEAFAPGINQIGTTLILPKHIWEKEPVKEWREKKELLNNPIGSGVYKVIKFEANQYVKLEANENYYGNKPKTKYFIYKQGNQETAQMELKNKEIDIVEVTNLKKNEIEALEKAGFKTTAYPQDGLDYLGLNLRNDLFKDKRVRQALNYALDKEGIINKVLDGNANPLSTPMLPTLCTYPKEGLNDYKYDINKAKALLKEAGWQDKDNDGVVENSKGEKLKFKVTFASKPLYTNNIAPIIQKSLKDIGVSIELEPMDFKAVVDKVVGNHDYEAYIMTNMLNPDLDPKPYWHSTSASDEKGVYAWNISSFKNEKADKLMEDGLKTVNKEERVKIYSEYGKILNDELPWICLYSQKLVKAYNPKLNGFEPSTFLDLYNIENWYITE